MRIRYFADHQIWLRSAAVFPQSVSNDADLETIFPIKFVGVDMPERNLVPNAARFSAPKHMALVVGFSLLWIGQLGCSKLRNTALHETLVPPSQQAVARAINQETGTDGTSTLDTESSSRAVRNYLGQKVTSRDPEARIIRQNQDESKPAFKLTASTEMKDLYAPAPSIAAATNSLDGLMGGAFEADTDESCEHTGQCDCQRDPDPLKLAKVQPFDPAEFSKEAQRVPIAPSIASAMKRDTAVQPASAVGDLSNDFAKSYRVASNATRDDGADRAMASQLKGAKELVIDPSIRNSGPVTTATAGSRLLSPINTASKQGNVTQFSSSQPSTGEQPLEVLTLKANATEVTPKVMKLAAVPSNTATTRRPAVIAAPAKAAAKDAVKNIPAGVSSTLPALGDIRVEPIQPESLNRRPVDGEITVTDIPSDKPSDAVDRWNLKVEPIQSSETSVATVPVEAVERRDLSTPVDETVTRRSDLAMNAGDQANAIPLMIVTSDVEIQPEIDELPIGIVIPCPCGGADCLRCGSSAVGDNPTGDESFAATDRSASLVVDRGSDQMRGANNFSPIDRCACGKAVCVCESSTGQTQRHLMVDVSSGENSFEPGSIEPSESKSSGLDAGVVAESSRSKPTAELNGSSELDAMKSGANEFEPTSASNDFVPVQPEATNKPIPPAMPPTEGRANDFEISPTESSMKTLDRADSFSPLDSESNVKPEPTLSESETQPVNIGSTSERPTRPRRPVVELEVSAEKVMPAESAKPAYVPAYTPVDPYTAPTLGEQIAVTIEKVRQSIDRETDQAARNGLEVNLQLLELLSQQASQIDANGRMVNNDQKRSLHHQLKALSTMLANGQTQAVASSSDTLESLQQAVEELQALAELRVVNGRFCTEITGFGKFKAVPSSDLAPNQRLLMYCEVENQTSIAVNNGSGAEEYRTHLQGSMVIYDANGQVAQRKTFPSVTDVAMNRRRDFYLYFPFQLENLPAGEYRLELILSDLNGNKSATLKPGIHFSVAR